METTGTRESGEGREILIAMTGFSCLPLHLPTDFVVYFFFHLDTEEAWLVLTDKDRKLSVYSFAAAEYFQHSSAPPVGRFCLSFQKYTKQDVSSPVTLYTETQELWG